MCAHAHIRTPQHTLHSHPILETRDPLFLPSGVLFTFLPGLSLRGQYIASQSVYDSFSASPLVLFQERRPAGHLFPTLPDADPPGWSSFQTQTLQLLSNLWLVGGGDIWRWELLLKHWFLSLRPGTVFLALLWAPSSCLGLPI